MAQQYTIHVLQYKDHIILRVVSTCTYMYMYYTTAASPTAVGAYRYSYPELDDRVVHWSIVLESHGAA